MPGNEQWNKRLKAIIPWGSSTCSKAAKWTPEEPAVIVRGKGCRVWDADGREFIDFRNGLGPVTLGHQFPAVNEDRSPARAAQDTEKTRGKTTCHGQ